MKELGMPTSYICACLGFKTKMVRGKVEQNKQTQNSFRSFSATKHLTSSVFVMMLLSTLSLYNLLRTILQRGGSKDKFRKMLSFKHSQFSREAPKWLPFV